MRKSFFLITIFFVCLMYAGNAYAYNDTTTHPALTDTIVDFYNVIYPGQAITSEEREWIIQGSMEEDTAPRWVNHFYDPISGEGWTGENAGDLSLEEVKELAKWGIFLEEALPATSWIHAGEIQEKRYALYGGDRTWEKGVQAFADGDREIAYRSLGHALHVLEDMAVPDHTRNDTHADTDITPGDGSPYEDYAQKWTRNTIKEKRIIEFFLKDGIYPIEMGSIDEHIQSLATYSNKYFVSKDTVNNRKYTSPDIAKLNCSGSVCYGKDDRGEQFALAFIKRYKVGEWDYKEEISLETKKEYKIIFDAYFDRLSRQAVLHGADVIRLFRKDVAIEVEARDYPTSVVKYDFGFLPDPDPENISFVSPASEWLKFKAAHPTTAGIVMGIGGFFGNIFAAISDTAGRVVAAAGTAWNDVLGGGSSETLRSVIDVRQGLGEGDGGGAVAIVGDGFTADEPRDAEGSVSLEETGPLPKVENVPTTKSDATVLQQVEMKKVEEQKEERQKAPEPKQCPYGAGGSTFSWKVVVSEVAWMGTAASSSDEWIELANVYSESVDISGWHLVDKGGQINVIFPQGSVIPSGGYFLLERTDDSTVPGVPADLIYKGTLSNSAEGLRLFDADCRMMDEALGEPKWPAGDSASKRTMERTQRGFLGEQWWHTSSIPGGTPRAGNDEPYKPPVSYGGGYISPSVVSTASSGSAVTYTATVARTPEPVSCGAFSITEIMYDAPGSDAGAEWIEIRNDGSEPASVKGMYLFENGVKHTISCDHDACMMAAGGYGILTTDKVVFVTAYPSSQAQMFQTSFSLKNTGEEISLVCGEGTLSRTNYDTTIGAGGDGKSLQYIDGVWLASAPTPGTANVFVADVVPEEETQKEILMIVSSDEGESMDEEETVKEEESKDETPIASSDEDDEEGATEEALRAKLLISEMQISGETADDEWIELYNPNDIDVSLVGWSVRKRTKTGSDTTPIVSSATFGSIDAVIPARGYFLITHPEGYTGAVEPDARYSSTSYGLSADNTVYILNDLGDVSDMVGYGDAGEYETSPAIAPGNGESIERKNGGSEDTDDNAADLVLTPDGTPTNAEGETFVAEEIVAYPVPVFSGVYDEATSSIFFSWEKPSEGTPSGYRLSICNGADCDTIEVGAEDIVYTHFVTSDDEGCTLTASIVALYDGLVSDAVMASLAVPHRSVLLATHILLSEIRFDAEGSDEGKEFVELYNPTDVSVDVTDWELSYTGESAKTLVTFGGKEEDIMLIAPQSFLLIGLNGYDESAFDGQEADVTRSASIPNGEGTLMLYDGDGNIVDAVVLSASVAAPGESVERYAWEDGEYRSPTANESGEFLGNGYDTDKASDFIARAPQPQNAKSLPEPREAPEIDDSEAVYDKGSLSIEFTFSECPYEATYSVMLDGAVLYEGNDNTFSYRVIEVGKEYVFSLQVVDRDGLASSVLTVNVLVPSLISSLAWYTTPEDSRYADDTDALLEFSFDEYPFLPYGLVYNRYPHGGPYKEPNNKLIAFYLNTDAAYAPETVSDSPYAELRDDTLVVYYRSCHGYSEFRRALALSDSDLGANTGTSCYYNEALYDNLYFTEGDTSLLFSVARQDGSATFSSDDQITAVYYEMEYPRDDPNPISFRKIAVESVAYPFSSTAPSHERPSVPTEVDLTFDETLSMLRVDASGATDADTRDDYLKYEISYDDGETWGAELSTGGFEKLVTPGETYAIYIRTVDDFGNTSEPAIRTYTAPTATAPLGISDIRWWRDLSGISRLDLSYADYPVASTSFLMMVAYMNDMPQFPAPHSLTELSQGGTASRLMLVPPRSCSDLSPACYISFSTLEDNEAYVCDSWKYYPGTLQNIYLPLIPHGVPTDVSLVVQSREDGSLDSLTEDDYITLGFYKVDSWGNVSVVAHDTHRYYFEP